MGPAPACVVLVSCADAEQAAAIARRLVGERLAACGNVLPGMRSIYRWQGSVHDEPEALLILKTVPDLAPALCRRVGELHSYQVPEAIVLPVEGGLPAYLSWVGEQVHPPPEPG